MAGTRFLVLTPFPNLPKIGGHGFDPRQLFAFTLFARVAAKFELQGCDA